jgi:hypothetical protein
MLRESPRTAGRRAGVEIPVIERLGAESDNFSRGAAQLGLPRAARI